MFQLITINNNYNFRNATMNLDMISTITTKVVSEVNDGINQSGKNITSAEVLQPNFDGTGIEYFYEIKTGQPVVVYLKLPPADSQPNDTSLTIKKITIAADSQTGLLDPSTRVVADVTGEEHKKANNFFVQPSDCDKPADPNETMCTQVMPPIVFSQVDPTNHQLLELRESIMLFGKHILKANVLDNVTKVVVTPADQDDAIKNHLTVYLRHENNSGYISKYDEHSSAEYISGMTLTYDDHAQEVRAFFSNYVKTIESYRAEENTASSPEVSELVENFSQEFMTGKDPIVKAFEYIGPTKYAKLYCDPAGASDATSPGKLYQFALPKVVLSRVDKQAEKDKSQIDNHFGLWVQRHNNKKKGLLPQKLNFKEETSIYTYEKCFYEKVDIAAHYSTSYENYSLAKGVIMYLPEGAALESKKTLKFEGDLKTVMHLIDPNNNQQGKDFQMPLFTDREELKALPICQKKQPKTREKTQTSSETKKGKKLFSSLRSLLPSSKQKGDSKNSKSTFYSSITESEVGEAHLQNTEKKVGEAHLQNTEKKVGEAHLQNTEKKVGETHSQNTEKKVGETHSQNTDKKVGETHSQNTDKKVGQSTFFSDIQLVKDLKLLSESAQVNVVGE